VDPARTTRFRLLTGLYPSRHGCATSPAAGSAASRSTAGGNVAFPLAAADKGDASRRRSGTAATRPAAPWVAKLLLPLTVTTGSPQGFGFYDDAPGLLLRVHPPITRLVRMAVPSFAVKAVIEPRRQVNAGRARLARPRAHRAGRAFLFVNYMEPHQPWMAEAALRSMGLGAAAGRVAGAEGPLHARGGRRSRPEELGFIVASYDGPGGRDGCGARASCSRPLKGPRRAGTRTRLVIVTADHGEMLGDHGTVGHMGRMLYEPLVHVPLVVKFPGAEAGRAGRDERPVQIVDVTPTAARERGRSPHSRNGRARRCRA